MPAHLPKCLVVTGAALLLVSLYLAYNFVGLSRDVDPSPTLLWTVVGSGFLLTSSGLTAYACQLSRGSRRALALSLFLFGLVSFGLAITVAHVGLILLLLSIPALFASLIVGLLWLLPFPQSGNR